MRLVFKKPEIFFFICIGTIAVLGLYFSSLYSYLLFHNLIEIITISIAFTLFSITWNTRKYLASNYLRLIGIGYVFIAVIDLIHTLAYKGMNIFPAYGANLPTQLWIAARYFQAVTLIAAPLFVERRLNNHIIFTVYTGVVSTLVAIIFSGNFPACYIDGKGLTTFKINSEYVITILLLVSLFLLFRKRKHFNNRVFILIASSVACTVISEMSFTAYISVYGFANMVGHFAKLSAFYLIYQAILVTGLKEPFDLIFRDLKQAEESLRRSNDTLEEKVRERVAELHESEERYRSLIRNVQTAIVLHDGQGQILNSNPLAHKLLGLSEDQLLGKSLINPEWHFLREDGTIMPIAEYPVSIVLSSQRALKDFVMGIKHPDNDDISWLLVNAEPEYDHVGKVAMVIVSFIDITERKRAEELLHRLNRELQAVSSCNQVLVRAEDEQYLLKEICRIICDEAGYRLAWVGYAENDEAKSVRPVAWGGFDSEYVANTKLSWADDVERGRGPGGTAIRSGKIVYIQDIATDPRMIPWKEHALQRGYRSIIGLPLKDVNTNTFGVLLIYSTEINAFTPDEIRLLEELAGDLAFGIIVLRAHTERKQAELSLRESEKRYRIVADNTYDWEFWINPDGLFLYNSPSCQRITGYTVDKFACEPDLLYRIVHPDDREHFIQHQKQVTEEKIPGEIKFRILHADGNTRYIGHVCQPVIDEQGQYLGKRGSNRDITEQKQAEEEIQKLNQELEQRVAQRTNQLELANKELEAFAYSIAHDLRTPLRGIDGFSQVLIEEYQKKLDKKGKNYLQRIYLAAQRMAQLIDDLLNLSRLSREEMNIQQINLSDMVQEIAESLHEASPERQVEFIIQKHIITKGDDSLLRIVMENLIGNAWKFTATHPKARIEFGIQQKNEEPVYFVRDDGAGFDTKYAEKLFGAFQRLHSANEFPGTGIGLAMVQCIIHRHGGDVWAEGEVEKGATFYFTIP